MATSQSKSKIPKSKRAKRGPPAVDKCDGGELLDPVLPVAHETLEPQTQYVDPLNPRVRTRTEIRAACANMFDRKVRVMIDNYLDTVMNGHVIEDPDTKQKVKVYFHKDVAAVTTIGQLLANVGVGMIGVNQIDPADVPNLPAPIFQSADPDAPLPDGKPG